MCPVGMLEQKENIWNKIHKNSSHFWIDNENIFLKGRLWKSWKEISKLSFLRILKFLFFFRSFCIIELEFAIPE